MGNGDETLRVEDPGPKKANPNGYFKSRSPRAGRVWNQCGEGPIIVAGRNTEDERGTYLGGHA